MYINFQELEICFVQQIRQKESKNHFRTGLKAYLLRDAAVTIKDHPLLLLKQVIVYLQCALM